MKKTYKIAALSCAIWAALGAHQVALANPASATGLSSFKIDSSKSRQWSNTYRRDPSLPKVTGYLSNWTHYDQNYTPTLEELGKYDTLLLSFFGLCGTEVGDTSVTSGVGRIKEYCETYNLKKYELSGTDMYADGEKTFDGFDFTWKAYGWLDPEPNGYFGVLKKVNEVYGTRIGISIFGWSLSNVASQAVRPENRDVFINSLIEFVTIYPFIGQLDIDWEYPGIKGASENIIDAANDARNYKEFIAELRRRLDEIQRQDVVIGIASGAPHDKIDAAKLDDLVKAGVDNIHLMTYDFFGLWDSTLNHHTNLYSSDSSKWSSDKAIQYMINDLNIPSENIQIGYANYSRNGIATSNVEPSPLRGSFKTNDYSTAGSWEAATHGINDILANYVNVQAGQKITGKNGYQIFTDKESNADFLYNESNKLFISLDTPRTVYAKSQYTLKHDLGGIFVWMVDQDQGLMLNAAREGLGYEVEKQVFDMKEVISTCGVNITSAKECEDLTFDGGSDAKITLSDQTSVFVLGSTYDLTAVVSGFDASDAKAINWTLVSATGVNNSNVVINNSDKLAANFTVNVSEVPMSDVILNFKLDVELENGLKLSDSLVYALKVNETVPVISGITHSTEYSLANKGNMPLNFIVNAADSGDSDLQYEWEILSNNAEADGVLNDSELVIKTGKLLNKPRYDVLVKSTVSNRFGNTDSLNAITTIVGDASANNAPIASFGVTPQGDLVAGSIVTLVSNSQDELLSELSHSWSITKDGQMISADTTKGGEATFIAHSAGDYNVVLTVSDVFDVTDSASEVITVEMGEAPVDPDVPGSNTWVATKVYDKPDIVQHNGTTYQAQWYTQGDNPENSDPWGPWIPTSSGPTPEEPTPEEPEEPSPEVPDSSTWDANKVYDKPDTVIMNGVTYRAKWWTQGDNPEHSGPYDAWEKL